MNLHLVLNTAKTDSGKFIMKVTTEESKYMEQGLSSTYSGLPSGTVNGEDIGDGIFAGVFIGKFITRTKG